MIVLKTRCISHTLLEVIAQYFFFSVMCWPLLYQKTFEVKALIRIRPGWPFTNLSSLNPDAGNGCLAPVLQVYVIMKIAVLRSLTADDPHR